MPLLSTSAVVTVPSNRSLIGEVLSTNGNQIKCIDPQLRHQESFVFHRVFTDQSEFNTEAYANQLYPLVQKTIEGESTVAVICGPASLDVRSHVLTPDGGEFRGLLSSAAADLIAAAHRSNSGHMHGSVAFSWFKIDTSASEGITDILKNASGAPGTSRNPPPPFASSSATSSSSSSSSATQCDMNLLVREIGRGRGMFVPGLWEVEIANGADVDAVVTHVSQALRSAHHAKGTHHTVFSLTYKPAHLSIRGNAGSASKGSYLVAGGSNDPPGLGRLTFLLLSNLSQPQSQLPPTSASVGLAASGSGAAGASSVNANLASSSSQPSSASNQVMTMNMGTGLSSCYEHLSTALQWISHRRPSPPFHKSRLVLMLRDVLCARQHSTWMLFLPSCVEELEANYQWLRLLAQVEMASSTSSLGSSSGSGSTNNNSGISSNSSQRGFWVSTPTKHPIHAITAGGSPQGAAAHSARLNSPPPTDPSHRHPHNPQQPSQHQHVLTAQLEVANVELAAAQTELAAIKTELQHVNKAYTDLNAHIDSHGSSLKKRDAEAFKKAMADVKDYDIYRQVMEAAMVRLQSELETLHAENKALRGAQDKGASLNKSLNKVQDEELKAAVRGYSATKKALKESEAALSASVALCKKLTKERDAAKAVILESHQASAALKNYQAELATIAKENDALRKQANSAAAAERKVFVELEDARQAHRRTLAKVLELQAELGALREGAAGEGHGLSHPYVHNNKKLQSSLSRDSLASMGDANPHPHPHYTPQFQSQSQSRSRSASPTAGAGRHALGAASGSGSGGSSLQQALHALSHAQSQPQPKAKPRVQVRSRLINQTQAPAQTHRPSLSSPTGPPPPPPLPLAQSSSSVTWTLSCDSIVTGGSGSPAPTPHAPPPAPYTQPNAQPLLHAQRQRPAQVQAKKENRQSHASTGDQFW